MLVNRNIKQGSRATRWAMGGYAPDLLRVPFQAAMSEPQIRAGDDGLDQTPPPLVAGSLQLLGVGHRQEAVAETTDENAFFRWKGIGGSGRAGLEGSEGGERRVLEKSSLERPIRGERRRWWPHGAAEKMARRKILRSWVFYCTISFISFHSPSTLATLPPTSKSQRARYSLSADDTALRYRKSGQRLPVARCLVYFLRTCKLRTLFSRKSEARPTQLLVARTGLKGQSCSNVPAAADQQMGLSFRHRMVPMSLEMLRQMVVLQQPQHRHRRHHRHANRSARCEAVPSAPPSTVITTPPPLPATAPAISAPRRQHAPASSWAGSTTRPVRASPDRNPRSSSSCGGGRWPIESFAPAPRACAGAPCSCCIWQLRSW